MLESEREEGELALAILQWALEVNSLLPVLAVFRSEQYETLAKTLLAKLIKTKAARSHRLDHDDENIFGRVQRDRKGKARKDREWC